MKNGVYTFTCLYMFIPSLSVFEQILNIATLATSRNIQVWLLHCWIGFPWRSVTLAPRGFGPSLQGNQARYNLPRCQIWKFGSNKKCHVAAFYKMELFFFFVNLKMASIFFCLQVWPVQASHGRCQLAAGGLGSLMKSHRNIPKLAHVGMPNSKWFMYFFFVKVGWPTRGFCGMFKNLGGHVVKRKGILHIRRVPEVVFFLPRPSETYVAWPRVGAKLWSKSRWIFP